MSNYIKATDFAAKDSLASGSPAKVIKGTELNTEFNAIQTAVATKADTVTTAPLSSLTSHTGATSGAHTASAITNIPSGNLTSTTVQAALNELQADVDSRVSATSGTAPSATNLTGVAQAAGYSVIGQPVSYNSVGGPQVLNQGGGGAAMHSYHRQGAFGVNFGLDTDNILKIGGWSMGAVSYQMLYPGTPNAPGTAPVYGCRAWVSFDGFTGGIIARGNVASVSRNAAGRYTITFTTPMPDTGYIVNGTASMHAAGAAAIVTSFSTGTTYEAPTTTSFKIALEKRSDGASIDVPIVSIAVFR